MFVLILPLRNLFAEVNLLSRGLVVFIFVVVEVGGQGCYVSGVVVITLREEKLEPIFEHVVVIDVAENDLDGVILELVVDTLQIKFVGVVIDIG